MSCSRFCRSIARVGRLLTVCNLAALKNRIAVLPCYCVLVCNCVKQCIVGRIACDLGNIGGPAFEYVCILIRCFLLRCCSVKLRSFSIGYFICLKNFIVAFPNDCVFIKNCVKYGVVGRIACNSRNLGRPAFEYISVLSCCGFLRDIARICRNFAVANLINFKNRISVLPGYLIDVCRCVELCRVCCVACNGNDFGSPALEGVCVLSCSRIGRSCACVCRLCAVGNLAALKNRIAVLPCYGIFSENRIKLCRVCLVACNGNDFGRPALEGVCVLSCSRIGRSCACVCRLCAVGNLAALKNRIAVLPCYGIFSENRIKLCRVCLVACNGNDFGRPALEGVCVLSCSRLGRSCACVCRLCAVGNLAALKNRIAVFPCYGIGIDFPLRVKNGVFADVYSCAVCVSRSASVGTRVPAFKGVSRTGEAVGFKLGIDARFNALGLFCNAAEVRIESYCYINRFLAAPFLVDEFY